MLSAAGLLNSRSHMQSKPPTPGSAGLQLVSGKHLASPYGLQTDVYRRVAAGAGRVLSERKSNLHWDDERWIKTSFAR
jgi:hypothetical protein